MGPKNLTKNRVFKEEENLKKNQQTSEYSEQDDSKNRNLTKNVEKPK